MNETRKTKKIYLVATWLFQAQRKLGQQRLEDIHSLVYSLRVDQMENGIDRYACNWNLDDAYKIGGYSRILLPTDKLAVTILLALKKRIPTTKDMGLKRCSSCGKELPQRSFTGSGAERELSEWGAFPITCCVLTYRASDVMICMKVYFNNRA